MRRFSFSIVLALCALFISIGSAQQTSTLATTASTVVPNLIRYSGTLKDGQGAALSSSVAVGVTFSIYKQQDGGGAVWMETQNITPEANGNYNVLLGSTTATGLPSDLFSQEEQRWLGVQVQGQAEQARVLLVSVPYAFKAHETETLGGLPAPALIKVAQTSGFIPVYNGTMDVDSAMSQDSVSSPTVVTDSVMFSAMGYEIRGVPVLSTANNNNDLFIGPDAGFFTSGSTSGNTYTGYKAGAFNTIGSNNAYYGYKAGSNDITGASIGASNNIAIGYFAGHNNAGNNNVYVGNLACIGVGVICTEHDTIRIGNQGAISIGGSDVYIQNPGGGSFFFPESNTIRIGSQGAGVGQQNATYIAGIYNSAATPTLPTEMVCVDSVGLLFGTTGTCPPSSRRFKENILDMGDSSSKLFQLRPVTFFYKPQYDDGSHTLQYGLIAEEVAKVYSDMVAYDKDGQPYTVKYQYLAPMLLNELQKEHTIVMAQQDELQTQLQQIKAQRQEIDGLKLQLQQQNASLQERLSKLESTFSRR